MAETRTTVRLQEPLLRRVKTYARQHNITFTALMERALDAYVARPADKTGTATRWKLPAVGSGGLKPGINLDKTSELLDALDSGTPIDKLR